MRFALFTFHVAMKKQTTLRYDPFGDDLICTNPEGVELRRNRQGHFFLVRVEMRLGRQRVSVLEMIQNGKGDVLEKVRCQRTITPLTNAEVARWAVETLLPEELQEFFRKETT